MLSLSMLATEQPEWEGPLPVGLPAENYTIQISGRDDRACRALNQVVHFRSQGSRSCAHVCGHLEPGRTVVKYPPKAAFARSNDW